MRSPSGPLLAVLGLLPGPVWAHYPHDVASFVAPSPVDPGVLLTTLWRTDAWAAVRVLDDQEAHVRYLMPGSHYLGAGVMVTEDRVLVGTENAGLWVSEDQGDSWGRAPGLPEDAGVLGLAASPQVASDGRVFAVGTAGVWVSDDHGLAWVQGVAAQAEPFVGVAVSPGFDQDGRVCAVSGGGGLWCSIDGGVDWSPTAELAISPWAIALGAGERVWLAHDGGLWRSQDGGVEFADVGLGAEPVSTVRELADGTVLAATLLDAVWRSLDAGDTWELSSSELERPGTSQGGPRAGEHYFDLVEALDGTVYLASWEGVARSEDGGLGWTRVHTETQAVVRGVALSHDQEAGLLAVLATYGGGLMQTQVGAPVGESLSRGVPQRYLRTTSAAPEWTQEAVVALAGAGQLWISDNAGQTWTQTGVEVAGSAQRVATPGAGHVVAGGEVGNQAVISVSEDSGAQWIQADVAPCAGSVWALWVSADWGTDGRGWAACQDDGALLQTTDGGLRWAVVARLGATVRSVAAGPDRVWLASADGLWRWDGSSLDRAAFDQQAVQAVATSADGQTVVAMLARGGWFRSDDGGQDWTELPRPTEQLPLAVALSPRFAADQGVVVGTHGGAWASADRGQSWRWLNLLEIHEEDAPAWVFRGDWRTVSDSAASGGQAIRSDAAGAGGRLDFAGVRADLRFAASAEAGTIRWRLDGGQWTDLELDGSGWVWVGPDLQDGPHQLEIERVAGTVVLDGADVWRQHPTPEPADTGASDSGPDTSPGPSASAPAPARCGCTSAPLGHWGLLAGLALWVRRRA